MGTTNDILHYGVAYNENPPGRGSGRYPYGSGENPNQHQFSFISEAKRLREKGLSESEIAKILIGEKATSSHFRAEYSMQVKQERQFNMARAVELLDKYEGNISRVAKELGKNESTVRSWLDPVIAERTNRYEKTAEFLKSKIGSDNIIDVSSNTELYINNGVSDYTKKVAIAMLEKEGYVKSWVQVQQLGTQNKTSIMVLAPPGTSLSDIQKRKLEIKPIVEFTPDDGKTWWVPQFPESIDSKRVFIRYAEDGGKNKDGVIELREGVADLSLGSSRYSQVRIAVDGSHFMKGMAIYSKDIPEGYDVVYNTNKHVGTDKYSVFKEMKRNATTGEIDRDNPFKAVIRNPKEVDGYLTAAGQSYYTDANGKQRLSLINKIQDEGDWSRWSRTLSSQFLSKQPLKIIEQQLDISIKDKKVQLDEIMRLTNPSVKKRILYDFAEQCDSNASSLSAKGFKNQAYQVILPVTSLKDSEIYAPNYKHGETVALVRYPHGGVFEIPILKVNKHNREAKDIMGNSRDAVGINGNVAEILSGADFDGDAVVVIPIDRNKLKLTTAKPLTELKGFNHLDIYKLPPNKPTIKHETMQNEMGRVTNLITDMTVGGATFPEISKAVKHSMVVIDSEKHHLNYKQSEKDNDILDLKRSYQGVNNRNQPKGASTILSRASSEIYIPKRKEITNTKIMTESELQDFNNGKRIFRDTNETRTKMKNGIVKNEPVQIKVSQMDITDDATTLVRDRSNQKEMAYAKYANNLKAMANVARKEARSIKPIPVSKSAKDIYQAEVESLNSKLHIAKTNNPRERQATVIGNEIMRLKMKDNPDMDFKTKQKERSIALTRARAMVGAHKDKIDISDREWEAIQANAISTNKLNEIISNSNIDILKQKAMPKNVTKLTPAQISLAKTMYKSDIYTNSEIAERLGISTTTLNKQLGLN